MIRALIFDCFGVLTTDAWREFCALLPADIAAEADNSNRAYTSGFIDESEFIARIKQLTGKTPKMSEYANAETLHKNIRLLRYIASKKPQYKIGMISNIASNWVRESFLTPDEVLLFDDMVLSYEVGISKPDSRIFELACQRLGVLPNESLFVDDVASYCAAAETTGLYSVHYKDYVSCTIYIEDLLH